MSVYIACVSVCAYECTEGGGDFLGRESTKMARKLVWEQQVGWLDFPIVSGAGLGWRGVHGNPQEGDAQGCEGGQRSERDT